jgi:hypothetical protein
VFQEEDLDQEAVGLDLVVVEEVEEAEQLQALLS